MLILVVSQAVLELGWALSSTEAPDLCQKSGLGGEGQAQRRTFVLNSLRALLLLLPALPASAPHHSLTGWV